MPESIHLAIYIAFVSSDKWVRCPRLRPDTGVRGSHLEAYDTHSAAVQAGQPDSVLHPDAVAKSLQVCHLPVVSV